MTNEEIKDIKKIKIYNFIDENVNDWRKDFVSHLTISDYDILSDIFMKDIENTKGIEPNSSTINPNVNTPTLDINSMMMDYSNVASLSSAVSSSDINDDTTGDEDDESKFSKLKNKVVNSIKNFKLLKLPKINFNDIIISILDNIYSLMEKIENNGHKILHKIKIILILLPLDIGLLLVGGIWNMIKFKDWIMEKVFKRKPIRFERDAMTLTDRMEFELIDNVMDILSDFYSRNDRIELYYREK